VDYDKTNIPEAYNRGRDHGPAFLEQWMQIVAGRTDPEKVQNILDLGCGTGRFSEGLATRFNANLVGIDPSSKMLRQAIGNRKNGRVLYASGLAEAVPLAANSIDLIFISMVFHHFNDPRTVAEECNRVLRSHGRVCLRTACVEKIELYAYVPFFPTSRRLLEKRLPSLDLQREVFEAASFQTLSCEVVTQEVAADYNAYADKVSTKADSILASLDDREFDAGLNALRFHAATTPAIAITEPIDFLVFGKR
jgi:ubiquinone/menaquinone biosynthesis C-methylase UbiE